MKTDARKVAAFRKRLANRQAAWTIDTNPRLGWEIDIPARRRITLELTPDQQALLRRETKHLVPSVTLVMYSDELGPKGHALACLNVKRSEARATARPGRRSRTARS